MGILYTTDSFMQQEEEEDVKIKKKKIITDDNIAPRLGVTTTSLSEEQVVQQHEMNNEATENELMKQQKATTINNKKQRRQKTMNEIMLKRIKEATDEDRIEKIKYIAETYKADTNTLELLTKIINSRNYTNSGDKQLHDLNYTLLYRKYRKLIDGNYFNNIPHRLKMKALVFTFDYKLIDYFKRVYTQLDLNETIHCLFLPTIKYRNISKEIAEFLLSNKRYRKVGLKENLILDSLLSFYSVTGNAEAFCELINEKKLRMSLFRFVMLADVLVKAERYEEAVEMFEQGYLEHLLLLPESELKENWNVISKTIAKVLKACILMGNEEKANEIFKLTNSQFKEQNYGNTIFKDLSKPLYSIKKHLQPNISIFKFMVRFYLENGKPNVAIKIFNSYFDELKYIINNNLRRAPLISQVKEFHTLINILLKYLIKGGEYKRVDSIVESITNTNSELNRNYRNLFSNIYGVESESNLKLDANTFALILKRYAIEGDFKSIEKYLKRAHQFVRGGPTIAMVNTAYEQLTKRGYFNETQKLLNLCKSEYGQTATKYNVYLIIKGYALAGKPDMCVQLLQQFRKMGCGPLIGMYNVIIGCYLDAHDYEKAIHYFHEVTKNRIFRMLINSYTINHFVHYFKVAPIENLDKFKEVLDSYLNKSEEESNNKKNFVYPIYVEFLTKLLNECRDIRNGKTEGLTVDVAFRCIIDELRQRLYPIKSNIAQLIYAKRGKESVDDNNIEFIKEEDMSLEKESLEEED
ncbi:hypothetical protein ABK040_004533 [Willaertia magna]